ncbi:MAG: hypothetical protein LBC27_01860 [Spirochaetaceae bacterium]|nr:hypothetical protein [Spirochaetaceae bacterium]
MPPRIDAWLLYRGSTGQSSFQQSRMLFIGIDLHTNRFTCSYRDENSSVNQKAKQTETFDLTE